MVVVVMVVVVVVVGVGGVVALLQYVAFGHVRARKRPTTRCLQWPPRTIN